jgi:hypothetical protein
VKPKRDAAERVWEALFNPDVGMDPLAIQNAERLAILRAIRRALSASPPPKSKQPRKKR